MYVHTYIYTYVGRNVRTYMYYVGVPSVNQLALYAAVAHQLRQDTTIMCLGDTTKGA